MVFQFYTDKLADVKLLSVDGIAPKGVNLSHWPNNRTAQQFKADTSTEIALLFNLSPDKEDCLKGIDIVTNNHYDADGLLAVCAILFPDFSLEHRQLLIEIASTGDFRRYTSDLALKIELTIANYSSSKHSPLYNELQNVSESVKRQTLYVALLNQYTKLLLQIDSFKYLWEKEYHQIKKELQKEQLKKIIIKNYVDIDFAVIHSPHQLHEITINSITTANRILFIYEENDRFVYQFNYCVESWFELVSLNPLPRINLTELVVKLNEAEPDNYLQWICDSISKPVASAYCIDSDKKLGLSNLCPDIVIDYFVQFFTQHISHV